MNSVGNGHYNEESINENKAEHYEEFNFKFISRNDFNAIYKSVQRRRRDELEKKQWDLFIKKKAEEEKKKEGVKKYDDDTTLQCSGCYWTNLNSSQVHRNEMLSSIPLTFNSNYDECLETPKKEFSLQLPSSMNENLTNRTISSDFSERLNTVYSQHLSSENYHDSHVKNTPRVENLDISSKDHDDDDTINEKSSLDYFALEYEFTKMESLRSKIIPLLISIQKLMLKGGDADEDGDRIKMRSIEFSNRFKRNYLYQMQCIVKEIEKLNDKQKPFVKEVLAQKFISAYQSCLQNLQVIEKNLPRVSMDSIFTLLNDFFMCFCELTSKLNLAFGDASKQITEDIVPLCEQIMNTMIDLIKVKPEPKKKVPKKGKKRVKDNLWMYSNKNSWASKATALAKSRFTMKNQEISQKNASSKKIASSSAKEVPRIPSSYTQEMVLLNQKSKLNIRNRNPVAEDEIKTMVEMTNINETDNSDINEEELLIDVSPTLLDETSLNDQIMEEKIIEMKEKIPILSHHSSGPPSQNIISLKKNQVGIKNAALIFVQSNTTERAITPEELNDSIKPLADGLEQSHSQAVLKEEEEQEKHVEMKNEEVDEDEEIYRIKLRKFREEMGADDILDNVSRMSKSILKESMQAVVNEFSLENILTKLLIEELEDK